MIKLYEGCWVKTLDGSVMGPVTITYHIPQRFSCGETVWMQDGSSTAEYDIDETVIAVYDSLAEASASNPDM